MIDAASKALLPIGLHDTLAPMAEREASVVSTLLNSFYSFGYGQIAAPLAEFEETLLSGVGASEGRRMFRLMDPASRQMLGIPPISPPRLPASPPRAWRKQHGLCVCAMPVRSCG